MAKMVSLCDTETVELPVVESPVATYAGAPTYPAVEQSAPVRIGPVATPFMLHLTTSSPDNACPRITVERIITCPNGCATTEHRYEIPTACAASHLLPAGLYDITVCNQEVSALAAGETLSVTFMVEPVSDSFATIYSAKV